MRRFRLGFLTFLLLALAGGLAHAKSPWGVLNSVPEEDTFSVYAIDNLIDNRPIRYAVSEEVTPEEEQIFKENILKWPAEVLKIIQDRGRAKEFRDITHLLEKEDSFVQKAAPGTTPDIMLRLSRQLESYVAGDFHERSDEYVVSEIRINKNLRATFASVSLHEIGHYFGLSDQYEGGRANSHPEYSSDIDETESAVMNNGDKITKDDADGFINLLDLRLAQRKNGQFSKRAQKGWRSLNPKSKNIYQNGNTINRNPQDPSTTHIDDERVLRSREYSRGRLAGASRAFLDSPLQLFAITPADTVKRNRKTKLITSIYSVLEADDPSKENFTKTSLTWQRTFAYPSVVGTPGQRVVSVRVSEYINGAPLPEYTINIHEDGSLSGEIDGTLTSTKYYAKMITHGIEMILRDRQIQAFVLNEYNGEDSISLLGDLRDNFVRLFRRKGEGKQGSDYELLEQCVLPPNKDCDWRAEYFFKEFVIHRDHLMSFYQNFYDPLFNNEQQQARQQVQDSIRARR